LLQFVRLRQGSGKSIQDKTAPAIRLAQALGD
jgi:hypothetical protein